MQNHRDHERSRTVIVGGGAAGCALAARLAADETRTVVLIEAGPAELPADLRDGTRLPGAAPDHPANWAYPARLDAETPYLVARGRALGGSSAINGGAFVHARASEFAAWARAAGPEWTHERMLPLMRAIEDDPGAEGFQGRGIRGPLRVVRRAASSPVERAFIAAAHECGFPAEPDKNDPAGPLGVGPMPSLFVDGVRRTVAEAYGVGSDERIEVRSDERVLRVRFDGSRAVGVETTRGNVDADEVILCAGAIGSAHLLLASGVGPGADLERHGVPVIADLPVGTSFSDHPDIAVAWTATAPPALPHASPFPAALNWRSSLAADMGLPDDQGDLEIILVARPLTELLSTAPVSGAAHQELSLLVSLQVPLSRGTIRLAAADPRVPPEISYGYLASESDAARLREGVRTAAALLASRAFAPIFSGLVDLDRPTLTDDSLLSGWIRRHLGTALHGCGSAPMGSVVDGAGRVRGVDGLRVADTSILPTVPSRGPFATAVLIGEAIAALMRAGR